MPTKKQKTTDDEREQESQGIDTPLTERDDSLEEIMDHDEQMSLDFQVDCQQKQQNLEYQDENDSDNQ